MSSRTPLDVIAVKTPCSADWNSMTGDDRVRFCRHCGRHVHDLAALTSDEAQRPVCESAGQLCIRVSRSRSGKVLTLDYAKDDGARRWRYVTRLSVAASVFLSFFWASQLYTPQRTMGDVVRPGAIGTTTQPATPQCGDGTTPVLDQPTVGEAAHE